MLTSTKSAVLDRGVERYGVFKRAFKAQSGAPLRGRLLDFGCGAGALVAAALKDGIDAWGIETDVSRQEQMSRLAEHEPRLPDRISFYPGRLMPYPSCHFDCVYSWFVFEHVTDPQVSLREIVRVLKPGGALIIHAEDARNAWDGHAKVPWPPYLPREFAAAYLDGLGLAERGEYITDSVVYISTPVVVDILTTLGMSVLASNQQPSLSHALMADGTYVTNAEEARELGRKARQLLPTVKSPAQNLFVHAIKPQRT